MAGLQHDNTEFALRGFNHVAFVARDMEETVRWYSDVLGMKLIKTQEMPDGGQHFFLDMGNGCDGIAFFWWPDSVEGTLGDSIHPTYDDQMQRVRPGGRTAIGTMNHIAFDVAPDHMDEYVEKLRSKGIAVTDITNHANSLHGKHKDDYDADTDGGDVFVRSCYFKDPNGVLLEFAAWTTVFGPDDVSHRPKTIADRAVEAAVS